MRRKKVGLIERIKAAWLAFRQPKFVQFKDPLTGALSRTAFELLAERELARAERGQPLSVVFFDLDNFKQINDERGHGAGDLFLKEFAKMVMTHIRQYDLFARYGEKGDEFLLLLSDAGSVQAEKIVQRIHDLFPRFSWGVSPYFEDAKLITLIEKADAEMYRRKEEKKTER
jgi:diguanylate cyclase (GGDEF)-like protein